MTGDDRVPGESPRQIGADEPVVPGGLEEQTWTVHGHSLSLLVPADPDALLDDPEVIAANAIDDRMPYWAWSWRAANVLIEALPQILGDETTIEEIGCGLGWVAIAAAALRPAATVHASDHDALAIELLRCNAARCGLPNLTATAADWSESSRGSVVLASDVLYETRFHRPLTSRFVADLTRAECPASAVWISDPGRHESRAFLDGLAGGPLDVATFAVEAATLVPAPFQTGQLRLIRLRAVT